MPKLIKGSEEAKAKMKHLREMRTNLKMVRTAEIDVPKKLLYIDPKGKEKIINTMTPKNNISRRNRKTVFQLGISNDNDFHIKNGGISRSSISKNIIVAMDRKSKYASSHMRQTSASTHQYNIDKLQNKKKKTKADLDELNRYLELDKEHKKWYKGLEKDYNMYQVLKE